MGVVTKILQKVSSFLSACSPLDLVIMGVIVLIPVLAIILAIASRRARKRGYGSLHVGKRYRQRRKKKSGYDDYYLPRKHRVRYVKTKAPKARKRVKTEYVYCKPDQARMLATGIFGVGLGMMLHRSVLDEKRRMQ